MSRAGRWAALLGLAGAWLGLSVQAARLALHKSFSIDEFQYAHAAWLVARGQVPYRDFFEVHLPLVYQVLAPVFWFSGDSPLSILALRAAMLVPLVGTCVAAASLNRRQGPVAMLLAPVLLLATPPFVTLATEVRPDPLAFALFLGALALLAGKPSSLKAFGAGALLVAAVWGSQKVLFYGGLIGLVLAGDLVLRRGRSPALLFSPRAFFAGAAAVLAVLAAYLTVTRSWGAWWQWCFAWAAAHQRHYPGFSWRVYLAPVWTAHPWLFTLAALGLASTVREGWRRARWQEPDLLLGVALPATFGAYALQQAPFPYSLLPFLGILAVLAARGVAAGLGAVTSPGGKAVGAAALIALLAVELRRLEQRLGRDSNARQREVLAQVGTLTAPGDVAYDNSGGYVSRPHAYFYFYTDAYLRGAIAGTLAREVPEALLARGCVLHLEDLRKEGLPASLKRFLSEHYQPFDGDISLWGQRYEVPPTGLAEARFLAVRADTYFIEPASALEQGTLFLDGAPVTSPVFTLEKGAHTVRYEGQASAFHVLWLPENGQRWTPRRGLPPTYSRLF
ncbi:hypothetical protein SAMN05444354_11488 [Stigmatella aurantiaca]|uniref:Glycosyltransferase RgtA/B/C/D-like domain-containing protein n=1 Tax=Stigmatella aurantiaca TaxID=41 RepID=A0A1H7X3M6_STIAU|nr:hypothetical protein [Stigmatella aurantiaca]SEM28446.1 hypothetical protein SAMN05444354_11488 [Stigmatella aurantiaca]